MPKGIKRKDGTKVFGPYKGSAANGGRPIMVVKRKDGSATSTNAARYKYEKKHGKLPRNMEVDHKDNGGRAGRDGLKNLRVVSKSKNVGMENKRRAKKAPTRARKAS
jgi:mRNA-degrading endonuclease toxin of MazEF toxin-antitoxin module